MINPSIQNGYITREQMDRWACRN